MSESNYPKQELVSTDSVGPWYEAWIYDGEGWNGWVEPLFEFDEALKILNDSTEDEYSTIDGWRYDREEDRFYADDSDVGPDAGWWEGETIETELGEKRVYPIGAGEWTWDTKD